MKTLWELLRKLARSLAALTSDRQPIPPAIEAIPRKERLPNEARLLGMYRMGETEGYQKGYQRAIEETTLKRLHAVVYIDPAKQGAYDQPSPVTDPELQRRLEARKHQEALQAEIMAEQERKEKMKAFVANITGQPNVLTGELPAMTGDLRRKWQTGKLKPITLDKPTQKLDPEDGWTL